MWRPLFSEEDEEDVPITHVTNGAHLPTFLSEPFRAALRPAPRRGLGAACGRPAHVGAGHVDSQRRALARTMCRARTAHRYIRQKSEIDRLQRGEQIEYVRGAATTLDAGTSDARLRAPARHLQARLPARPRSRASDRACSPANRPCSSSSPGRHTRGTRRARTRCAVSSPSSDSRARWRSALVVLEDYDLAVARELSRAATSGSTCHAGRWRRAGRAE